MALFREILKIKEKLKHNASILLTQISKSFRITVFSGEINHKTQELMD